MALDLSSLTQPLAGVEPASPPLLVGPTIDDWQWQRAAWQQLWLDYLGSGPEAVPLEARVEAEEDLKDCRRLRVSYQVEEDWRVEAYLLRPQGEGPWPGVVVFHPTTDSTIDQPAGLAPPPEKHFALQLARRGYVALCPPNYLWNYRGHPVGEPTFAAFERLVAEGLLKRWPGWTGMGKMVWDGLQAVDYLLTVPGVDAARLGCVGHSLGAKEVLYAMAFDERLQAGVSSEGGVGIEQSNWTAPWYLGEGIAERPDLAHQQLVAMTAPRALLVLGGGGQPAQPEARTPGADGPESWETLAAARPAFELLGAGERLGLMVHHYGHSVPPAAAETLHAWLDHWLKS
jgi:dienelactone hydrolase